MIDNVETKVKALVPLAIKEAIEKHFHLGEPVVFAEGDTILTANSEKETPRPLGLPRKNGHESGGLRLKTEVENGESKKEIRG